MILEKQARQYNKTNKIHYKDITNAYEYWEIDNYVSAREMLFEKLPYMIWKICNRHNLQLSEDWHSHIFEYLDWYLCRWWTNIDATIRNAIKDYWRVDRIIDYTHYAIDEKKCLSEDYDTIFVSETMSSDSEVEYLANVDYLANEIKASLWILEDKEREMFIAYYLRKPPMSFQELSEVFGIDRHLVSNVIRTSRIKLFNHLKHYDSDYNEIDMETIEWVI